MWLGKGLPCCFLLTGPAGLTLLEPRHPVCLAPPQTPPACPAERLRGPCLLAGTPVCARGRADDLDC